MSKEDIKQLHKQFKHDDTLPPLDDNDSFFDEMTTAQKSKYLFQGLKKALKMFRTHQKDINMKLMEKVVELETRIERLEGKR